VTPARNKIRVYFWSGMSGIWQMKKGGAGEQKEGARQAPATSILRWVRRHKKPHCLSRVLYCSTNRLPRRFVDRQEEEEGLDWREIQKTDLYFSSLVQPLFQRCRRQEARRVCVGSETSVMVTKSRPRHNHVTFHSIVVRKGPVCAPAYPEKLHSAYLTV
jgi:hypothetical protein